MMIFIELKQQNSSWNRCFFCLYCFVSIFLFINKHLGYVHTKPDKFENATFFIRIGLPSTLKRCPKTELFENALQSG